MKKQIAVLLNGGIKHDSRVIKICKSLSQVAEVHLFYINGSESDNNIFINHNVTLHSISYHLSLKQNILRHSFIHKEFDFFYAPIIQLGISFDLIYANDFPTLHVAIKLKKHFNAKLIYDSHEIYAETINQFFLKTNSIVKSVIYNFLIKLMRQVCVHYEKKYLKQVDKFITVNKSLANYFKEKYSLSYLPQVVMNFPYFYNTENVNYLNIRKKYNVDDGEVLLLYQGNLNYGRGLELMLEVMKKLPEKYKFLIIGDGILRNNLENLVIDKSIQERVFFLGYIDNSELLNYTKEADIGFNLLEDINKSKAMASPNKLFEYIQAEIPSINTDTPENRKIITQYNNGWLIKNSISEIVELIISISEKDIENIKLNCKTAKKELCWEKQEEILLNIIK